MLGAAFRFNYRLEKASVFQVAPENPNKVHQKNTETSSLKTCYVNKQDSRACVGFLQCKGPQQLSEQDPAPNFMIQNCQEPVLQSTIKTCAIRACARTAHISTEAEADPRITRKFTCLLCLQAHKTRTTMICACIHHYPSSSVAARSCSASHFHIFSDGRNQLLEGTPPLRVQLARAQTAAQPAVNRRVMKGLQ